MANNYFENLDALYEAGDNTAIETYILNAMSAEDFGSVPCAALYNELAGYYRGSGRYDESEEAFNKALRIFESISMEVSEEYATVLLNLSGLYRIMGCPGKSVDLYFGAMKKIEEAHGCDSYAYISVLNNLALAYQDIGDYYYALEYAAKALTLMRGRVLNENEIAASLNNLAMIHLNLGDIDNADRLITESLVIYDSFDKPDVHHAAALTTKGIISFRAGYHYGALDSFSKALMLTRLFFGENLEFAACKRNIADVYELLGDPVSAAAELKEAAEIMEHNLGADHHAVYEIKQKLRGIN